MALNAPISSAVRFRHTSATISAFAVGYTAQKKFSRDAARPLPNPAMPVVRSYLGNPPARRPMANLLRSSRWQ